MVPTARQRYPGPVPGSRSSDEDACASKARGWRVFRCRASMGTVPSPSKRHPPNDPAKDRAWDALSGTESSDESPRKGLLADAGCAAAERPLTGCPRRKVKAATSRTTARESTVDRCGNTLQWRPRTREADHLSQQQVVKPGTRNPSRLSPRIQLQDNQRRGWAQPIRP